MVGRRTYWAVRIKERTCCWFGQSGSNYFTGFLARCILLPLHWLKLVCFWCAHGCGDGPCKSIPGPKWIPPAESTSINHPDVGGWSAGCTLSPKCAYLTNKWKGHVYFMRVPSIMEEPILKWGPSGGGHIFGLGSAQNRVTQCRYLKKVSDTPDEMTDSSISEP